MNPIKINQLHAFEFDNGQDLLNGPVGTWFEAPADKIMPPEDSPTSDNTIFVRSQSCGPGWYQIHPAENRDETEKIKTTKHDCTPDAPPPQKRRFSRIS
tara:strand:+ start:942 stop:1238 length:297 start_codon:yes stop_codon:yes gene_type:complete